MVRPKHRLRYEKKKRKEKCDAGNRIEEETMAKPRRNSSEEQLLRARKLELSLDEATRLHFQVAKSSFRSLRSAL